MPHNGAIEEAGKAADGVIRGLVSGQPHMLAMIVLNVLLVGSGLYLTLQVVEKRNDQMMLLFERCVPDNLYPQYDQPPLSGKSDRAH